VALRFRIVCGEVHQHANAPHTLLLRTRRERPRSGATGQRDEIAPAAHSMTSSARASNVGATVRPSA
jgi:hypothetical protein